MGELRRVGWTVRVGGRSGEDLAIDAASSVRLDGAGTAKTDPGTREKERISMARKIVTKQKEPKKLDVDAIARKRDAVERQMRVVKEHQKDLAKQRGELKRAREELVAVINGQGELFV